MQAGSIAASMCLCLTLLTACAFTNRFEPTSADERAIASTIESFLAAYHAQDYATITSLTTPDATMTVDNASPQSLRESIAALRANETPPGLLQVTPATLVNFQHPSPDVALVESYVHTSTDRGVDNAQIKLELAQRGNQWLVRTVAKDTWTTDLHSRGGGP